MVWYQEKLGEEINFRKNNLSFHFGRISTWLMIDLKVRNEDSGIKMTFYCPPRPQL